MSGILMVLLARPVAELKPQTVIHLGKTADWVAVTDDAVWVGSTGPFAVHRIDPETNKLSRSVELPGEPCAGLAVGFKSLWVPLCTTPPSLARINLQTYQLTLLKVGPAAEEGGIAVSSDSVWMVTDKEGTLARITPEGEIRQTVKLPKGSFNPVHADGKIWITRVEGEEITRVDAATGAIEATVKTGPNPRFLAAGERAVWTLNQGDGSLTRVEGETAKSVALGTPGKGGDITVKAGMVWTTMFKTPLSCTDAATGTLRAQWSGPGGDSLGVSNDAIWLTDYRAGTISRLSLKDALKRCRR
jgi:virginiamycin B lyase